MCVVLSIETATDLCSVAVASDGRVLGTLTLDRPRRHAEQLVPMIDDILRLVGMSRSGIGVVAVSSGPGSYTGLRIGAATAKGIAFALDARLVPVPSLQALAGAVPGREGSVVVAAFAARREEVYAATYRLNGTALPDEWAAPAAGSPESMLDGRLGEDTRSITVVGDGGTRIVAAARRLGIPATGHPWIRPAAGAVARAGILLAERGHSVDADTFEPYYLREFTARPAARSIFERIPF